MLKDKPKNVDEYIKAAPKAAQENLKQIRSILKEVAPNATEELKWGIPVFSGKRILFSFAAYKAHLTFTPTGPALDPFKEELVKYSTRKDSVQFPYNQPIPNDLIRKIAEHRIWDVNENDAKWKY